MTAPKPIFSMKPVMAADGGGPGTPKPACPICKKVDCICPPTNDPK